MQFDLSLNPNPVGDLRPISILAAMHREPPKIRCLVVYLRDSEKERMKASGTSRIEKSRKPCGPVERFAGHEKRKEEI